MVTPNRTGPFKVAEYRRGQSLKLVRHEAYVPGRRSPRGRRARVAYADALIFTFIPDATCGCSRSSGVEVHCVERVLPDRRSSCARCRGSRWWPSRGRSGRRSASISPRVGRRRSSARRCLSPSTTKKLNRAVYYGTGKANNSLIPESQGIWRTREHARMFPYDVEKAKALLKQIGYNGEPIDMPIQKGDGVGSLRAIHAGAARPRRASISRSPTWSRRPSSTSCTRAGATRPPPWDFAFLAGSAFRPDPDQHYYTRAHTSAHVGMYSNPAYDKLVEEARKEPGLREAQGPSTRRPRPC